MAIAQSIETPSIDDLKRDLKTLRQQLNAFEDSGVARVYDEIQDHPVRALAAAFAAGLIAAQFCRRWL